MKDELKLLGKSEGVLSRAGQSLASKATSCLLDPLQTSLVNHDCFPSEPTGSLRALLNTVLWAATPVLVQEMKTIC